MENTAIETELPRAPFQPRRILVRGVNWLGDAVMTTPALLRLREHFPSALIALLTPEKLRGLWLHHPAVDEIITFTPEESPWIIAKKVQVLMWPETKKQSAQILCRKASRLAICVPPRQVKKTATSPLLLRPRRRDRASAGPRAPAPRRPGSCRPG